MFQSYPSPLSFLGLFSLNSNFLCDSGVVFLAILSFFGSHWHCSFSRWPTLYLASCIAPVNHSMKTLVRLFYHLQGHWPQSADLQQSSWVGWEIWNLHNTAQLKAHGPGCVSKAHDYFSGGSNLCWMSELVPAGSEQQSSASENCLAWFALLCSMCSVKPEQTCPWALLTLV